MPSEHVIKSSVAVASATLCIWLTARTCTMLLAGQPIKPVAAPCQRGVPRQQAELDSARALGKNVLARNMFDAETGGMTWMARGQANTTRNAGSKPQVETTAPAECDGPVRLVATVVSRDAAHSRTTIEHAGSRHLVVVGSQLDADQQILAIDTERVLLRNRTQSVCSVSMFRSGSKQASETPAPAAALTVPDPDTGITKLSDTRFQVARAWLDRLLASPSDMMRLARGHPHEENGRTLGLKLMMRAASPLRKLGMQSGDVLRAINGFDLSTPDGALEAYGKLREQQAFSISIARAGRPLTIEVSIE